MININKVSKITEIKNPELNKNLNQKTKKTQPSTGSTIRPQVVDAKVYKVKSAFVKNAVFITLSYVNTPDGRRPIEIFINSQHLIIFLVKRFFILPCFHSKYVKIRSDT